MYLFQISNYDDPAVDRETAELLHRHLEAESRRHCPAMWNAIDRIRTHAAKGPARERRTVRCRIYGVFLLALGLLTLILGLMPPRTTDVIIVGGAVIIAGMQHICSRYATKILICIGHFSVEILGNVLFFV